MGDRRKTFVGSLLHFGMKSKDDQGVWCQTGTNMVVVLSSTKAIFISRYKKKKKGEMFYYL